jgi:hypothetical protein
MTNETLTRAIRQRLSSRDDAELLRVWVENDRGTYSGEAFEAVRALLAERGIEPPPQNDPPPMATRAPVEGRLAQVVAGDPGGAFRLRWLRAVLWIGVALEGLRLVSAVVSLAGFLDLFKTVPRPPYASAGGTLWQWLTSGAAREIVMTLMVSAWFLVSAFPAMRLRLRSRQALVGYAWAAIGVDGLIWCLRSYRAYGRVGSAAWYLATLSVAAREAAYPLVLLVLLTRPQIRELFEPAVAGFEVRQGGTA